MNATYWRSRGRILFVWAFAALSLASSPAGLFGPAAVLADGKVFGTRVAVSPVQIPDQRAIIVCRPGSETLVIDTAFVGAGSDFAWVVPLPAKPEVRAVSAGVFDCLRAAFAPRVRSTPLGMVCFGVFVLFLISLAIHRRAVGRIALAVLLILFGSCVLLMPVLGKVRGISGSPLATVRVLERQEVGSFEVTTLAADEGSSLTAWLHENGFPASPKAQSVIDRYIADGWVFVASRLKRDQDDGVSRPHPLAFTFPTSTPVYPMRLTGIEAARPLDLELYVCGANEAFAPGMTIERSSPIDFAPPKLVWEFYRELRTQPASDNIVVQHEELAALIGAVAWGTKLVGTIPVRDLQHDIEVRWRPGVSRGGGVYEVGDVRLAAGTGVLLVFSAWAVAVRFARHPSGTDRSRRGLLFGALTVVVGFAPFVAMPFVSTTRAASGNLYWMLRMWANASHEYLGDTWGGREDVGEVADDRGRFDAALALCLQNLDREIKEYVEREKKYPVDTWRPVPKSGRSPGEYSIDRVPGGVAFRCYDDWGREWVNFSSFHPGGKSWSELQKSGKD